MENNLFLPNEKQIVVRIGDITDQQTDAIVNPANSRLIHGGGAARSIALKGGKEITNQSNSIIRRVGQLSVGKAVITDAGNLPCKFVIHVVGPQMGEGDEDVKLEKAVWNVLNLAESYNLRSLSMPAISSGIFGFPKDLCAAILVKTTFQFLNQPGIDLQTVVMCNHDDETANIFSRFLENKRNEIKDMMD